MNAILELTNISIATRAMTSALPLVSDVSFAVERGETVCIVGESGCGKSVTAQAIMGILGRSATVASGKIVFDGRDVTGARKTTSNRLQGRNLAMVFQDPVNALNPVHKVGTQIKDVLRLHQGLSGVKARAEAIRLLELVEIPDPASRLDNYPHELSGGMAQRVAIAIALATRPQLLIADEPTTALDVTIQAQILYLFKKLQAEIGTAILLITHDLGVVAEMADRVVVMYGGRLVETAHVTDFFDAPTHPYSKALLDARPTLEKRDGALTAIPGTVPRPMDLIAGCRFAPRCSYAAARCTAEAPQTRQVNSSLTACHFAEALL